VFGASSKYNIGFIMTPNFEPDGNHERPYLTVEPLAKDLGLTIDRKCDQIDYNCVKEAVINYNGAGNILICWEHIALTGIAEALGDDSPPKYPGDKFGQIWTDLPPYGDITKTNEDCEGLGQ
ncbi:hypothetical protein BGZ83_004604, partial [Gryganskiella cystojenkinii]